MPETLLHTTPTVEIQSYSKKEAKAKMDQLGQTGTPFLFLISYDTEKTILIENPAVGGGNPIHFSFPDVRNDQHLNASDSSSTALSFNPPSFDRYAKQFQKIQQEFQKGNIYLLNLTHSTLVHCQSNLSEIYNQSRAKYKVYYPGHFVVFSPEPFVRIRNNEIYTCPMKGTIRTDIPNARKLLWADSKEQAEHASVVDLLRNDLGRVAKSVQVTKYRYFEKVQAGDHQLWQTSSEIKGILPLGFPDYLGELIFTLLPAGSITGVPKKNAINIINKIENHDRGFYTGICGYFDGKNLDSGVMIRFIEQTPEGLFYKSGGGIHQMSILQKEYQELIEKIYVPVD